MNQLRTLLTKLKPREIRGLLTTLKRSRGRSKKKYELLRVISKNPEITDISAMKIIYGDSEYAKENFRKLRKRLEQDLLDCLENRRGKVSKELSSNKALLQLKRLEIMMNNSYNECTILNEIDHLSKEATSNQMFMSNVVLERLKCESFYLASCPTESLEKVKAYHELSKYASLANFFYLSCKRYYFFRNKEQFQIDELLKLRNEINEYYMISNEPIIGFYYHMGSIIINFINKELDTSNFHNLQIQYLQSNHTFLKKTDYYDEYLLLNTILNIKRLDAINDVSNYLQLTFEEEIKGGINTFLKRVISKPFEIDLTLQILLYKGEYSQVLDLVEEMNAKSIAIDCVELRCKLDLYALNAKCGKGDFENASRLFMKLKRKRCMNEYFHFVRPLYEFIFCKELTSDLFDLNYESYQRYIRRKENQLKSGSNCIDLNVQEALIYTYRFIKESLKHSLKSTGKEVSFKKKLQIFKFNFSNEELHIALFFNWANDYFDHPKTKALLTQYQ